jgi:hypothetical protein
VSHQDDAARAVAVALDMEAAVAEFNRVQAARGLPEFRTGIGINFGEVLVGNIGSERKMDYTVIGDMVNLASRLEGLTKTYGTAMLFSESVHAQARDRYPCRMIDLVQVKGKTSGVKVYEAKRELTDKQARGWERYGSALDLYYRREFSSAAETFREAQTLLPGDRPCEIFLERSRRFAADPPSRDWTGQAVMTEK